MFHRLENKFGKHAKIYVAITGITGVLLVWLQGRDANFFSMRNFGVIAMVVAWLFYLFILLFEKRLFARIFSKPEDMDGKKVFRFLTGFHWVILAISLFAVAAGVWQGHGG
jgi:drug/metabolite transporter (DMT)-like permease